MADWSLSKNFVKWSFSSVSVAESCVSINVLGFLAQNLTFACTLPLYLLLHLGTSPSASPVSGLGLRVDTSEVVIILSSVLLGFVLPAVLMCLPAPSIITLTSKQNAMALWQIFPINFSILKFALTFVSAGFGSSVHQNHQDPQSKLRGLRLGYITAFTLAATTRVSAFGIIGLNTLFPNLFQPTHRGALSLSQVLGIVAVTPAYKPSTIGEATFLLIQYDELWSGLALAIWASTLYLEVFPKVRSWDSLLSLALTSFALWVTSGFAGLAIAAIWRRDEIISRDYPVNDSKKAQ